MDHPGVICVGLGVVWRFRSAPLRLQEESKKAGSQRWDVGCRLLDLTGATLNPRTLPDLFALQTLHCQTAYTAQNSPPVTRCSQKQQPNLLSNFESNCRQSPLGHNRHQRAATRRDNGPIFNRKCCILGNKQEAKPLPAKGSFLFFFFFFVAATKTCMQVRAFSCHHHSIPSIHPF